MWIVYELYWQIHFFLISYSKPPTMSSKFRFGARFLEEKALAIIAAATALLSGKSAEARFEGLSDDSNADKTIISGEKKTVPKLVLKLKSDGSSFIVDQHRSHSSHSSHRSHSSHSSHSSHYSSSPSYPTSTPSITPTYTPPSSTSSGTSGSSGNRNTPVTPTPKPASTTGSTKPASTAGSNSSSKPVTSEVKTTPVKASNNSNLATSVPPITIDTKSTIADTTLNYNLYGNFAYPLLGPFKRVLYKGCKGEDVLQLQQNLKARGYDILLTKYFGDKTEIAVKKFQTAQEMEPTGRVDQDCWDALSKY